MVEAEHSDSLTDVFTRRQTLLSSGLHQLDEIRGPLKEAAEQLVTTLATGHKVLVAGNGGSAAEAQHFSAELVGRFRRERSPYAVLSLTTDTSILTAIANDYGFDDVFSRQVRALGDPADLFVAFSTSGESANLLRAADAAHARGMSVLTLTGSQHNHLALKADVALLIPGGDAGAVQELHMAITHVLCEFAEAQLSRRDP